MTYLKFFKIHKICSFKFFLNYRVLHEFWILIEKFAFNFLYIYYFRVTRGFYRFFSLLLSLSFCLSTAACRKLLKYSSHLCNYVELNWMKKICTLEWEWVSVHVYEENNCFNLDMKKNTCIIFICRLYVHFVCTWAISNEY